MKYTWLVEKYLEGELSGEALHKFELEILTNPEVAREVERIRALNRFMKDQHLKMAHSAGLVEDYDDLANVLGEDDISRQLEGLIVKRLDSPDPEMNSLRSKLTESRVRDSLQQVKSSNVLVRKLTLVMVSVAVLLLIGVSSLLLFSTSNTNYPRLYAAYYSAPLADIDRDFSHGDNPYDQALTEYNNRNFSAAFELFNEVPEQQQSLEYYYYVAFTSMELGLYHQAVELWNKLETDKVYQHDAMWYKSLCFLMLKDVNAARATLEEIIINNGYYKTSAINLIRKL